jgi:hypothetical protein
VASSFGLHLVCKGSNSTEESFLAGVYFANRSASKARTSAVRPGSISAYFTLQCSFKWAAVELSEKAPADACDNGEANFSWSRFEDEVIFYGARFHGPAIFWRTMFRHAAKFEAARFDAAVTFEASPAQACWKLWTSPTGRYSTRTPQGRPSVARRRRQSLRQYARHRKHGELRKRLVERGWTQTRSSRRLLRIRHGRGHVFRKRRLVSWDLV